MLRKRIIACLDVRDGRVVKGTSFVDLRDVGDPVALAVCYEAEGADEVVFLDISASAEGRATLLDAVRRTAERLFIPLTVGGGIRSIEDIARVLRAGADKVSVNTAAVRRPELLTEAAARFGSQCVVASIDAKRRDASGPAAGTPDTAAAAQRRDAGASPGAGAAEPRAPAFTVFTHGGRTPAGIDAIAWARECAERGAGEILLTSIDQDGRRTGYDLELTGAVARAVSVPVIASGGAGAPEHFHQAFLAGADAALAAGIFHDRATSIRAVKRFLTRAGVPVREDAAAEERR